MGWRGWAIGEPVTATWTAHEVELVRSVLGGGPARHDVVETFVSADAALASADAATVRDMTRVSGSAVALDPGRPEFWSGDPHPVLDALRAAGPVVWVESEDGPFWAVTRHAGGGGDLRSTRTGSSPATACC